MNLLLCGLNKSSILDSSCLSVFELGQHTACVEPATAVHKCVSGQMPPSSDRSAHVIGEPAMSSINGVPSVQGLV